LRRDPVLREARSWFLLDFNPDSLAELAAPASATVRSGWSSATGTWSQIFNPVIVDCRFIGTIPQ
jgi:hypothetical protein